MVGWRAQIEDVVLKVEEWRVLRCIVAGRTKMELKVTKDWLGSVVTYHHYKVLDREIKDLNLYKLSDYLLFKVSLLIFSWAFLIILTTSLYNLSVVFYFGIIQYTMVMKKAMMVVMTMVMLRVMMMVTMILRKWGCAMRVQFKVPVFGFCPGVNTTQPYLGQF